MVIIKKLLRLCGYYPIIKYKKIVRANKLERKELNKVLKRNMELEVSLKLLENTSKKNYNSMMKYYQRNRNTVKRLNKYKQGINPVLKKALIKTLEGSSYEESNKEK